MSLLLFVICILFCGAVGPMHGRVACSFHWPHLMNGPIDGRNPECLQVTPAIACGAAGGQPASDSEPVSASDS